MVQIRRFSHIQKLSLRDLEQGIYNREIGANTWVQFDQQSEFQRLGQSEFYDDLLRSKKTRVYRRLLYPITPIAAFVLLGILLRIYLIGWVPAIDKWFAQHFLKSTTEIYELGEFYRLFTYGILHANFNHLLFNGVFIAYIAYYLSPLLSWKNVIFSFVFCVFTGGVFSLFFSPADLSLGSSGGVFGLGGVTVVVGIRHWKRFPSKSKKYFGWSLFPYVAYGFLSGLYSTEVDNWCHFGGLIAGGFLGMIFHPELSHPNENHRIRLGGWILMGVFCGGVWVNRSALIPLQSDSSIGELHLERPSLWLQGAMPWGDLGWFSPTQQAFLSASAVPFREDVDGLAHLDLQLRSGAKQVKITEQDSAEISGAKTRLFKVQLQIFEENFRGTALIFVDEKFEYRVLFFHKEGANSVYGKLQERLFKRLSFSGP